MTNDQAYMTNRKRLSNEPWSLGLGHWSLARCRLSLGAVQTTMIFPICSRETRRYSEFFDA